jgi:glyoxylate reductase
MKNTALLINTARGPVINEKALVAALKSEQIGGAGLDVYECEPMIACTPEDIKDLCMLKNVILTPHTASATIEARQAMSRTVAENIIAFTEGREPKNIVKEK